MGKLKLIEGEKGMTAEKTLDEMEKGEMFYDGQNDLCRKMGAMTSLNVFRFKDSYPYLYPVDVQYTLAEAELNYWKAKP